MSKHETGDSMSKIDGKGLVLRKYCECGAKLVQARERENHTCDRCFHRLKNHFEAQKKPRKPKEVAEARLREALRHADPSTVKRFGKSYVFVG